MKKITTFIIIFILIFSWGFLVYSKNSKNENTKSQNQENKEAQTSSWNIENQENVTADNKKIEIISNRLKLKNIISKWDQFFQNDQLLLALLQYKEVLKQNPDDYMIQKRIWDILLDMKNFSEANKYYKMLLVNSSFEKSKYIQSLIYSQDINNEASVNYIKTELSKNLTNEEQITFYNITLDCLKDFHECKKSYEDYLFKVNWETSSTEFEEIKTAFETYANFRLDDIHYKNSLIIWALMKLKLYPIAINLSKKELKEKPNYRTLLQIISQSYFELWDYKNANTYFKEYFKLAPEDAKAAYLLGIINMKLNEYVLSNIFFEKALNLWYEDTTNVYRKLIHNFYLLWEKEKMYNSFEKMLLNEKDLNLDDFMIMINNAMENKNFYKAWIRSRKWLKLFPTEANFYAYLAKMEYDKQAYKIAKIYTDKWLELDDNNQVLNYIKWLLERNENNLSAAKDYFKKAISADPSSYLVPDIQIQLDNIESTINFNSSDFVSDYSE